MIWAAAAVVIAALGAQSFWIAHVLTGLRADIRDLALRIDRIENIVLRDHGERIARLEERATGRR